MSKRIVVFSDGTGNSAARLQKSNVWRLYQALQRMPGQIAYYDDGVGTSSIKPLAALGGAVGLGLARNVRGLYAFLCRNYEPGDEIYAFGFSRGAFTIRILGGLIATRGIAWPTGADLDNHVKRQWNLYRAKYRLFGLTKHVEPEPHNVKIKFMGLWDTVDAYGFPIEEMRRAWDLFIWPLAMRDRVLSNIVQDAYHALSIDDERQTFHPVLWTEEGQTTGQRIGQERISQVWFAGVHSNLGGGYPDDSLAHVSLVWMMDQAKRCGLVFARNSVALRREADMFGKIYNPRGGFSGLYRYMPRQIADLSVEENRIAKGYMVKIDRPKIHESVFARIRYGTDSYGPLTLPSRYNVVLADGSIVPGVVPAIGPATPGAQETEAQADRRCQRQAKLWDMVWKRRSIYFVTLTFTLALIAIPWLFDRDQLNWGAWTQAVSFVPDLIALFLPDFLSGWLASYQVNPLLLLLLLVGGLGFGWLGGHMEMRIRRLMRDMWKEWRDPDAVFKGKLPSGRLNSMRVWWGKLPPRRWIKYGLWPTLVGLFFYFVGAAIASQLVSHGAESAGKICADAANQSLTLPRSPCYATGQQVAEGESYWIRITTDGQWRDKTIPASPDGLGSAGLGTSLLMKAAAPFRRHLTEDWFKVMAKIGPDGLNTRALDLRPVPGVDNAWQAEFTANATGELFLYVNDAMLFWSPVLYANNEGAATIAIEPKAR